MRQVTGSMAGVVKGMEGAMRSMDLEKVYAFPFLFTLHHPQIRNLSLIALYIQATTADTPSPSPRSQP